MYLFRSVVWTSRVQVLTHYLVECTEALLIAEGKLWCPEVAIELSNYSYIENVSTENTRQASSCDVAISLQGIATIRNVCNI